MLLKIDLATEHNGKTVLCKPINLFAMIIQLMAIYHVESFFQSICSMKKNDLGIGHKGKAVSEKLTLQAATELTGKTVSCKPLNLLP